MYDKTEHEDERVNGMNATRVARSAQFAAGLLAIASGIAFAWDSKPVGVTCAAVALVLIVLEYLIARKSMRGRILGKQRKTMKLAKLLYNPTAENPTAGARGVLALAIGLSAPAWLDWRTSLLPLVVAVAGGLIVGLQLLSQAARQKWKQGD